MDQPTERPSPAPQPLHHVELWTHDLAGAAPSFDWLLGALGWTGESDPDWPTGRIWRHPSGVYVVLEQSPAVVGEVHDRIRPGLNHLALHLPQPDGAAVGSALDALDRLREQAPEHGWSELFAEAYPHAGGPEHTAPFLENAQGFEMEIVA
ncbi:VOC family protein [Brachybacterium halotolerans subsp. kimchii]|uniref:VOC family protein n=1 Tax=Brachybacterium halotolerans TaxID=2795215 RepID=UPI001E62C48D|nr:VOC family protein [Brachybacterium halotolerans]UEJ81166.1 VOC family protein [Brachybacterium halotolerans subsp. kimchii]